MQPPELTLIVAATRNMGIGAQGTMPWKGLRKEMQYFARVTTRLPPQAPSGAVNAVIMGRKTWDSIPAKFRPLKDRLNIIITRSAPLASPAASPSNNSNSNSTTNPATEPIRVSSLDHALRYAADAQQSRLVSRVFVMGGAQIYDAALKHPAARRVLLTSIRRSFECDTFFPLDLHGGQGVGEKAQRGWARRSVDELKAWTGEEDGVVSGEHEEAGTKYEFQMWERVD